MLAATAEKTKRGWDTRRTGGRGRQRMLAQFAVSVLAHDEADDDDRTQLNSTQTELRVGERGGSKGRGRRERLRWARVGGTRRESARRCPSLG